MTSRVCAPLAPAEPRLDDASFGIGAHQRRLASSTAGERSIHHDWARLMPQFSTKRRMRHSPAEMFDLVADVERYPEFVPLCRSLVVRRRSHENGREIVVAEMTVAYKLIRETFTSRVTLEREQLDILVEYLDGPFSRMENRWRFVPVEGSADTCDVEFFISYEFRSRTLGLLMGTMFDAAFRRFAAAFERRADVVFGKMSPA
jgi:coenzyme Q-binding protein COQ10